MQKLNKKQIENRDKKRDLDAELRESLHLLKQGKVGRVTVPGKDGKYVESHITNIRLQLGLSQLQFAKLLGVSKRTLQDWEQGRRKPGSAAQSLLVIAEKRPDVLKELFL